MTQSSLRRWIAIPVGIMAVLLIVVIAAPFLIPAETIRTKVVAGVRDATGRDLDIKGGLSVSVFSALAVSVKDVSLSNAAWAGATPMVSLAKLDVRLKLLPLLSGKVEVDSFVLDSPDIRLQTDKKGHGNWEFTPAAPSQLTEAQLAEAQKGKTQSAPPTEAASSGSSGGMPSEIALGDVRITNGKLVYTDGVTNQSQTIDQLNLKIALPNLNSPLAVDGSVRWRDKVIALTLNAAKPRDLLNGPGSAVDLKVTSDPVTLSFAGSAALADAAKGEGDLDLSVPSLRGLVGWTSGAPLASPAGGLGPLSLKGHVTAGGTQVTFSKLLFALDAIKAEGDLALDNGKTRPAIKGKLAVERLDLNPYLTPASGDNAAAKPQTAKAPAPTTSKGWSTDPIDVSGLKTADVDLALSTGSIAVDKIEIGKTLLKLVLNNGRLTLDLTDMALYQGNAQGRIGLDGSGAALAADVTLKLKGLQTEPLLQAVADSDRLSGAVAADAALTTHGRSQKDLVNALNGRGGMTFTDGAIKGINLGAMVHNVASAFTGGSSSDEKTAFASLGGTYTITNGMMKNTDLALLSPLLRVNGAGSVDMPNQSVDYRITPKLAATTEGQGGSKDALGVSVPVIIQGPWDNLTYRPDLVGLVTENLKEPGKLIESVAGKKNTDKILQKIGPGGLGGLVPGLLGN